MVDHASILVVADTHSAALPADRCTPRLDDTGYRLFLRTLNLKDLHVSPPQSTPFFLGPTRSRIDTVACHRSVAVAVASYEYWHITLLSDHHAALLFTLTHPVVQLDMPRHHMASRTPEHHVGPVALSPVEEATCGPR